MWVCMHVGLHACGSACMAAAVTKSHQAGAAARSACTILTCMHGAAAALHASCMHDWQLCRMHVLPLLVLHGLTAVANEQAASTSLHAYLAASMLLHECLVHAWLLLLLHGCCPPKTVAHAWCQAPHPCPRPKHRAPSVHVQTPPPQRCLMHGMTLLPHCPHGSLPPPLAT